MNIAFHFKVEPNIPSRSTTIDNVLRGILSMALPWTVFVCCWIAVSEIALMLQLSVCLR